MDFFLEVNILCQNLKRGLLRYYHRSLNCNRDLIDIITSLFNCVIGPKGQRRACCAAGKAEEEISG